jgi:hypothetical protein
MIIRIAADNAVALEDAANFKAFKLVIAGDPSGRKPDLDGIRYIADDHAYIDRGTVVALSAEPEAGSWREGFEAMVAAAGKYGWIDETGRAIKEIGRAHV